MFLFSNIIKIVKRHKFNHQKAQKYEVNQARLWIKDNFDALFEQISFSKLNKQKWPGPDNLIVKEFFNGNWQEWEDFAEFIEDKSCIDIGCGPCSVLCIWYWVKTKILIDPLLLQYDKFAREFFGKSWFADDIKMYSCIGEDNIDELKNKIDGAIICRNALDHCDNPYKVLDNISNYAKAGCYLLLWTDLYHKNGVDDGHSNITKSISDFETYIQKSGFDIIRKIANIRNDESTVNYGCIAKKNNRF